MEYTYKGKKYGSIFKNTILDVLTNNNIEIINYFHMKDLDVLDSLNELDVEEVDGGTKIIVEEGFSEMLYNYNEETYEVEEINLLLITYISGGVRVLSLFRELETEYSESDGTNNMEVTDSEIKFDKSNIDEIKHTVNKFFEDKISAIENERQQFDTIINNFLESDEDNGIIEEFSQGIIRRADGKFRKRSKVDIWETEESMTLIDGGYGKEVLDGLSLKLRAIDNDELCLELGKKQVDTVINARWNRNRY